MDSLVLELQRAALDSATRVSTLLRKALVVARKLQLTEFEAWIKDELDGYGDSKLIPEYRRVTGQVMAWNPYRGWIPGYFGNSETQRKLSERLIGQRIGELETLADHRGTSGDLQVPFSPEIEARLMQSMDLPLRPSLLVTATEVHGIVEAVRNAILEWTLRLEEQGIVGEGMTFSTTEVSNAREVTNNYYTSFTGVMQSQIQLGSENTISVEIDMSALRELLPQLQEVLGSRLLVGEAAEEYSADLKVLEAQAASPRPKPSLMKESLRSLRSILENAAGGAVAAGLLTAIQALLR